jgi:hypothetical protein
VRLRLALVDVVSLLVAAVLLAYRSKATTPWQPWRVVFGWAFGVAAMLTPIWTHPGDKPQARDARRSP